MLIIGRTLFAIALTYGSIGFTQELGITLGAHESTAQTRNGYGSTSPDFGIHGGLTGSFLLEDNLKFRTGLIYTQRHFDLSNNAGQSYTFNMDYIDVPALMQYNFAETFGLFGGVIIAFNTSSDVSGTPTYTVTGKKDITPLFQLGFNMLFDNMYGFDVYYEQGFDNIDANTKQLSAYGASFIYYFY